MCKPPQGPFNSESLSGLTRCVLLKKGKGGWIIFIFPPKTVVDDCSGINTESPIGQQSPRLITGCLSSAQADNSCHLQPRKNNKSNIRMSQPLGHLCTIPWQWYVYWCCWGGSCALLRGKNIRNAMPAPAYVSNTVKTFRNTFGPFPQPNNSLHYGHESFCVVGAHPEYLPASHHQRRTGNEASCQPVFLLHSRLVRVS